ncbi:MAG: hypothetical protein CR993_00155 [Rhodobacterales bacterium]|nr:MAG: hypothetical protein CR993_00155 [Rhodobacterales bacterium]
MRRIKTFCQGFVSDEGGAVTVDWIVLTAVIVFLGVAVGFTATSSVPELADKLNEFMSTMPVGS